MKRPPSAFIYLAVFVAFLAFLIPRILHVRKLQMRSADLEREIEMIKRQNQLLEHQLRLLKEDPVYLEKVARDKLNKAKEGEIVYKIERRPSPSE